MKSLECTSQRALVYCSEATTGSSNCDSAYLAFLQCSCVLRGKAPLHMGCCTCRIGYMKNGNLLCVDITFQPSIKNLPIKQQPVYVINCNILKSFFFFPFKIDQGYFGITKRFIWAAQYGYLLCQSSRLYML